VVWTQNVDRAQLLQAGANINGGQCRITNPMTAPRLRLLIDGRYLAEEGTAIRGLGRYIRAMLESLPGIPGMDVAVLVHHATQVPPGVEAIRIRRHAPPRLADTEHEALLAWDIARSGAGVFHSPTVDPPLWSNRPWVQTVHDVIPLVSTDPAMRNEKKRWQRRARRIRNAAAVIAISRNTASDTERHLGVDPRRIHVIYHGVNPIFEPGAGPRAADPPYVLYVGAYGRNKGFPEAFEVAARLADAGYPHRLRVAGQVTDWARPYVAEVLGAARRPERVEMLGFVTEPELVELYRGATALVLTSRHEGFGRPPIEAMATATPVVAFDNSSIPEVVGDGGILVPDGDVDAFTAAVASLLESPDRWREMSGRALARAEVFDWKRCAEQHAEVFRSVAAA
jgi:glycosyltransferase involved in cell wall biosynthesis